jgi:hypothetical protein
VNAFLLAQEKRIVMLFFILDFYINLISDLKVFLATNIFIFLIDLYKKHLNFKTLHTGRYNADGKI